MILSHRDILYYISSQLDLQSLLFMPVGMVLRIPYGLLVTGRHGTHRHQRCAAAYGGV